MTLRQRFVPSTGAPASSRRPVTLMAALTFATGIVDAIGYLGLDRVFAGNMTGNVVVLGMGLARADALPVLGPTVALVAFVVGAAVAGRGLQERTGLPWCARTSVTLVVIALVLGGCAAALAGMPRGSRAATLAVTALLALAMGAQAAAARRLAVADMPTVVITSTLTGLATGIWRADPRQARRVVAVACLCAGGAAGALLLRVHPAVGVALSAVVTLLVARLGHRGITPAADAHDA